MTHKPKYKKVAKTKVDEKLLKTMKKKFRILEVDEYWILYAKEYHFIPYDACITRGQARARLRHHATNYSEVLRAYKATTHTYRTFKDWVDSKMLPYLMEYDEEYV